MVGTSDISGGAARAAFRMHKSLLERGVDSKMLVVKKDSDDPNVVEVYGKWANVIFFFRSRLDTIFWRFYKNKTKTLFSPSLVSFSGVARRINKINPDIVHLHWICAGMMSIREISKIKAPIVWTLHDMWAFTGGCHYDEECGGYKNKCGNCKVLGSKGKGDLSSFVWKNKYKYLSKIKNLTIIALSKWLQECALKSSLFKFKRIINLPNPIDIDIFKPENKNYSRKKIGLPIDKKLILFGAMSSTSDPRKGFKELINSLEKINLSNVELVVFGNRSDNLINFNKFKINYLGSFNSDDKLRLLYNTADIMIVPSLQENLSNTIMESLSCAVPVVSFNIGGNIDMIDHKKNGYLAKPFDPVDLARGIEWVLNNDNYEELCKNARKKVLKEFDSFVVADKYIDLYKKIIS